MAPIRTILSGREFSLSLDTGIDSFVDLFSVDIVTGTITSAWIPDDWISFMEEAVELENSVVPPLDRTALAYLGRLVKIAPMDDCTLTASAVTTAVNVQTLRITPFGGNQPSVFLTQLPHSLTGFFGTNDTASGLAPPTILNGDVIGPSNANSLVVLGAGITAGSASKSATVTRDTKGRVTALTETPIQITEAQVTGLVGDLANKADKTITITGADGCTGGGDLSANRTITLPAVGTPGTYGTATKVPRFTTDAKGRVTNVVETPITTGALAAVYGAYSNTDGPITIPVAPLNPLVVSFTDIEGESGVTLDGGAPGTKLKVATTGVYEFSFSPQLVHSGGNDSTISMWLRLNGLSPVPRSNSDVKLANNNDTIFLYIAVIVSLTAGDYVEWLMSSSGAGPTVLNSFAGTGGTGPNDRPLAPAVIASVKLIGT